MRSATSRPSRAGRVRVGLEVVEGAGPEREPFRVVLVPGGHACVEVPAVVVEAGPLREGGDLLQRQLLQLLEADHDVRHLHAGVVDVVLDLHRDAEKPQQPHQGVAERGVAQVPDVSRLVGIDGGVLDDGLADAPARPRRGRRRGERAAGEPGAIEEDVDVAVGRRLDALDAVDGAQRGDDLGRDRARRLAEHPGQLERHGDTEIAHRTVRRVLDRDLRQPVGAEPVQFDQHVADA